MIVDSKANVETISVLGNERSFLLLYRDTGTTGISQY